MIGKGRVVAVGHVGLRARDLEKLTRFYRETLVLRQSVYYADAVAIFEVGDVDVFIVPGQPGDVDFDFAVDDVEAFHARLQTAGVICGEVTEGKQTGHRGFAFTDPDGNRVHVTSAHRRAI